MYTYIYIYIYIHIYIWFFWFYWLLILETIIWNPCLSVCLLISTLIWFDGVSAGIEPGTCGEHKLVTSSIQNHKVLPANSWSKFFVKHTKSQKFACEFVIENFVLETKNLSSKITWKHKHCLQLLPHPRYLFAGDAGWPWPWTRFGFIMQWLRRQRLDLQAAGARPAVSWARSFLFIFVCLFKF